MRARLFLPLGRLLGRRPYTVVLVALLLVSSALYGITTVKSEAGYDMLVPHGSALFKANTRYQSAFGGDMLVVLLEGEERQLRGPTTLRWMRRFEREVTAQPELRSVTSPASLVLLAAGERGEDALNDPRFVRAALETPDGKTSPQFAQFYPDADHALVFVRTDGNLDLAGMERATRTVQRAVARPPAGTEATVAGTAALAKAVGDTLERSALILLGLSAALMALVLFTVFRARWRLLSLLVVVLAVLFTFGVMGFAGIALTMATVAVMPILFGLGVDYAIQFHNRYEEEERRGDTGEQALGDAVAHIGPPVTTAVLATVVGFLALLVSPLPIIKDFGLLLSIGVVACFLAGLFLVNVILYLRDRHIPAREARSLRPARLDRALERLARLVLPRPALLFALASLVAVGGFAVDHRLEVQTDIERLMPQSAPELHDFHKVETVIGSAYQINILVEGDVTSPRTLDWMLAYERAQQRKHREILRAQSPADLLLGEQGLPATRLATAQQLDRTPTLLRRDLVNRGGRIASMNFDIANIPLDEQKRLVDELERDLHPPAGVKAAPAGLTVLAAKSVGALTANRNEMTLLSLGAVLLALLAIYRRLSKAFFAILPIALVVGWSSAAMWILGIELNPLTVTLGALIIAIGTEFTVLLQGRYYEERERGLDPREAMTVAMSRIGRAVTASALTVIAGFSTLMFTDFPVLESFGEITLIDVAFSLVATLVVMPPLIVWWDERKAAHLSRAAEARGPRPAARPPIAP